MRAPRSPTRYFPRSRRSSPRGTRRYTCWRSGLSPRPSRIWRRRRGGGRTVAKSTKPRGDSLWRRPRRSCGARRTLPSGTRTRVSASPSHSTSPRSLNFPRFAPLCSARSPRGAEKAREERTRMMKRAKMQTKIHPRPRSSNTGTRTFPGAHSRRRPPRRRSRGRRRWIPPTRTRRPVTWGGGSARRCERCPRVRTLLLCTRRRRGGSRQPATWSSPFHVRSPRTGRRCSTRT